MLESLTILIGVTILGNAVHMQALPWMVTFCVLYLSVTVIGYHG